MNTEFSMFGKLYQSKGLDYLLLGGTGVRSESCRYFEGAVKSFGPAQGDLPAWRVAEVEGLDRPLRVHNNRVSEPDFGVIPPGTVIEGILDLHNSPTDCYLVWAVRRGANEDLHTGANL